MKTSTPTDGQPLAADPFLPRPEIVALLSACAARLILLAAPSGSGKSMALLTFAEARAAEKRPCHWVSPDALDQAPLAGTLLIDIHELPAEAGDLADFLMKLRQRCAAQQQILLAFSQPLPPLLRQEWIAGRAALIGPQDLAFSPAEAAELFASGARLREAALLHQFTGGWPLGLGLLSREGEGALALMRREGQHLPLPRSLCLWFDDWIAASPTLSAALPLLMDLAVLEHFPTGLIQSLPPRSAVAASAEDLVPFFALHPDGLFLSESDRGAGWLRFMPAFARYLRQRLSLYTPDRALEMQRFALSWSRSVQDSGAMVRHGLRIWSADEARAGVDETGALQVSLSTGPDIDLAQPILAGDAVTTPLAFFGMVYERIRHGAFAEARVHYENAAALTLGFTRFDSPQDPVLIAGWTDVFEALIRIGDDQGISDDWYGPFKASFRDAISRQPVQAIAKGTVVALLSLDLGAREEALAAGQLTLQLQERVRADRLAVFIHLHRASALIASARPDEALAGISEAQRLATLDSYADSYELVCCQIHAGLCAFERGQSAEALHLLEPCYDALGRVHGWRRLWVEYFLALAELSYQAGGRAEAQHWIRRGLELARLRNQPQLALAMDLFSAELQWRDGDAGAAFAAYMALAGRLGEKRSWLAPQIRNLAQILSVELPLALGDRPAALEALARIDRDAMAASDLRAWLRLLSVIFTLAPQGPAETLPLLHAAGPLMAGLPRLARLPQAGQRLTEGFAALLATGAEVDPTLRLWFDLRSERPKTLLSPREGQIIALISEGLSTKEIARVLGISEGTVKSHRKNLYEKLGVGTRSRAIARAKELQLIASG